MVERAYELEVEPEDENQDMILLLERVSIGYTILCLTSVVSHIHFA